MLNKLSLPRRYQCVKGQDIVNFSTSGGLQEVFEPPKHLLSFGFGWGSKYLLTKRAMGQPYASRFVAATGKEDPGPKVNFFMHGFFVAGEKTPNYLCFHIIGDKLINPSP